MSNVLRFMEIISENYNPTQPWMEVLGSFVPHRKSSGWSKPTMLRRGQGDGVRNAGISSIATTCQRKMMHSLFGVSSFKIETTETTYSNKFGKILNDEIDRMVRSDDNFVVGNDSAGPNPKPWELFGATTLPAPQPFRKVDGQPRKSFFGCWDYAIRETGEIIELKTTTEEFSDEPLTAGWRQLALYIKANRGCPGGWLIYLNADLSTLNPYDSDTYRAFYMSREEAMEVCEDIDNRLQQATRLLNWGGTDGMAPGSPEWFYRMIEGLPACDEPMCCVKANDWHSRHRVTPDWEFASIA